MTARAPFACPHCGGTIQCDRAHVCRGSKAWPAADTPGGLREQIGFTASRTFAQFWLAEVSKIEEGVLDPAARWEILRQALAELARRADKESGK